MSRTDTIVIGYGKFTLIGPPATKNNISLFEHKFGPFDIGGLAVSFYSEGFGVDMFQADVDIRFGFSGIDSVSYINNKVFEFRNTPSGRKNCVIGFMR